MMMVWARVGVRCCAVLVRVTLIVVITATTFCTQPPWSLRGGTKHNTQENSRTVAFCMFRIPLYHIRY